MYNWEGKGREGKGNSYRNNPFYFWHLIGYVLTRVVCLTLDGSLFESHGQILVLMGRFLDV